MPFFELMFDTKCRGGQVIGDYVMGLVPPTVAWKGVKEYEDKVFDLTIFWDGKPFHGKIPEFVKLIIKKNYENQRQLDLMPNPFSWLIFSERLVDFLWPLIKNDVQVFDPPIYRESDGEIVKGYKLLNPIRMIDCLDIKKTKITRKENGEISFCSNIYLKEGCIGDHHIFRIQGYFPPVIVSEQLVQIIRKNKFSGFAFLKYGSFHEEKSLARDMSDIESEFQAKTNNDNENQTIKVNSDDNEMILAMQKARDTFHEFEQEVKKDYSRIIPALSDILVKAYFYDDQSRKSGEHLWLDDISFEKNIISGVIVSSPEHLKSVHQGQEVRITLDQLSDWLYVFNGKAYGAYTVKLLRSRMSFQERQEHDKDYPFLFD